MTTNIKSCIETFVFLEEYSGQFSVLVYFLFSEKVSSKIISLI